MNWFRTGGGPCTLPELGCGPWVAILVGLGVGLIWGIVAFHFIAKYW